MLNTIKAGLGAGMLLLQAAGAQAAEPVKQIGIYVQPYYEAARAAGAVPRVAVGRPFDGLLSSNRREDIVKARDMIAGDPKVITPMTLMVLAIRFYDVGLRDDAVFWFYAAKTRYLVLADVVDVDAAGLSQVADAVKSFAFLAGPVINGYAFCDLAKQAEAHRKALDWVEHNPYAAMFMERFPGRPGERAENAARAIAKARADAAKESAYFADRKNVAEFFAKRAANSADVKYCW